MLCVQLPNMTAATSNPRSLISHVGAVYVASETTLTPRAVPGLRLGARRVLAHAFTPMIFPVPVTVTDIACLRCTTT